MTDTNKPMAMLRSAVKIEQCMSMLHDARYRYDLTDADKDDILKNVYGILGETWDLLKE